MRYIEYIAEYHNILRIYNIFSISYIIARLDEKNRVMKEVSGKIKM